MHVAFIDGSGTCKAPQDNWRFLPKRKATLLPVNLWAALLNFSCEYLRAWEAGELLFKQVIGQLEALWFVRTGIEQHQAAGAKTFESADVVFAKPASLVQSARMSEGMSPAFPIDVEVNYLLADRTLCEKRVKSPPNQQLYELHNPYR